MRKSHFKLKNKLSESIPDDMRLYPVDASTLAEVMDRFLGENFDGLIEINRSHLRGGRVMVSIDAIAYLIRQIVNAALGKSIVELSVCEDGNFFAIHTNLGYSTLGDERAMRDIVRTAKEAGFLVTLDDDEKFIFSTAIEREAEIILRAISSTGVISRFELIVFGIGTPRSLDD